MSHFEDASVALGELALAPPAPPVLLSDPAAADRMMFMAFPAGWFGDWHPAPRRQFFFQLSGELEVEVGDGELRRFAAGSVVLVEDLAGRGHTTRVVGDAEVRAAVVQLPAG